MDYNQAIALDPEDAVVYYNRGIIHLNLEGYEQAIADFDQAIALDPEFALAYHNRAVAYFKLGGYERAIVDFGQAIVLDPEFALAYRGLGIIYLYDKNNQNCLLARANLERYLEIVPYDPQADDIERELTRLCP